jgi:hypothetical protein
LYSNLKISDFVKCLVGREIGNKCLVGKLFVTEAGKAIRGGKEEGPAENNEKKNLK